MSIAVVFSCNFYVSVCFSCGRHSLVICSNVIALRAKYKEDFLKKHGVKLGFMSAFVSASVHALQNQPVVNAGMM